MIYNPLPATEPLGHYILCPLCRGSGADAIEPERYLCRECAGLGEVYVPAKVAA